MNHYKVNDKIFIDYMEAIDYCYSNNINIELIIKTKEY